MKRRSPKAVWWFGLLLVFCAAAVFLQSSLNSKKESAAPKAPTPTDDTRKALYIEKADAGAVNDASPASEVGKDLALQAVDVLANPKRTHTPEEARRLTEWINWPQARAQELREEIYARQEEVYLKMPRYEEVRESVLQEAAEMLETVDHSNVAALSDLARRELDAFWQCGSLAEENAYQHGWLARGIVELSLQKYPDNFLLLSTMAEAAASMTLIQLKGEPNLEAYHDVWPFLQKQHALILAGDVKPSPETMLAMWDYADVAVIIERDWQASVPALEWMVQNAQAGGWGRIKGVLQAKLELARRNIMVGQGLRVHTNPMETFENRAEYVTAISEHARRPCWVWGGKEYRETVTPLWEYENAFESVSGFIEMANTVLKEQGGD